MKSLLDSVNEHGQQIRTHSAIFQLTFKVPALSIRLRFHAVDEAMKLTSIVPLVTRGRVAAAIHDHPAEIVIMTGADREDLVTVWP